MPVASYFDMSGNLVNASWLILAGVVAEDSVWAEFGDKWRKILAAHPLKPKYIHMREAVPLQKEFSKHKGWTNSSVHELVQKLLKLLSEADKKRIKMSFCAVDMEAYRRLQAQGVRLCSVVDICNQNCPEVTLSWYVVNWPGVIDSADYFFDTGEPFKEPFEDRWTKMKNSELDPTGQNYLWQIIKSVTTIDDKEESPPIQAADVFAYAINRDLCSTGDRPYRYTAEIMLRCIPAIGNVWTEKKIREKYGK